MHTIATYVQKILPHDAYHWLGASALMVLHLLFPADVRVYQAFAVLLIIDTITGVSAAVKRGTFNSRSMRTKLLPKLIAYALLPGALTTFSVFLDGTPLAGAFALMAKFTIASVAFIELSSILENTGALLGRNVTLKLSAKEIQDMLSSNHVKKDG